jgi:hypothetical protein
MPKSEKPFKPVYTLLLNIFEVLINPEMFIELMELNCQRVSSTDIVWDDKEW